MRLLLLCHRRACDMLERGISRVLLALWLLLPCSAILTCCIHSNAAGLLLRFSISMGSMGEKKNTHKKQETKRRREKRTIQKHYHNHDDDEFPIRYKMKAHFPFYFFCIAVSSTFYLRFHFSSCAQEKSAVVLFYFSFIFKQNDTMF